MRYTVATCNDFGQSIIDDVEADDKKEALRRLSKTRENIGAIQIAIKISRKDLEK